MRALALLTASAAVLVGLSGCSAPDLTGELPSQASGPLPETTQSQLEQATRTAVDLSGSSGAVVGVWAPWSGSWTAAVGTQSRGAGAAPMTTSLHYRAAGMSTAMTCTVLLGLVDDGQVRLDERVSKVLPRMVGLGDITLGQLCTGTSGLADLSLPVFQQMIANPVRRWPPEQLIGEGSAGGVDVPPGGGYRSSLPAVDILGLALPAASGSSMDDLYEKRIVSPLRLTGTQLPDPATTGVPGSHPSAYAHAIADDGSLVCDAPADVSDLSNSAGWVAAGMTTDLDDSKVFVQALAKGLLVSDASAKSQWTTIPRGQGIADWAGAAFGAETAGPLRGYQGALPGYLTAAYSDPESGLTVSVMLNDSSAGPDFARYFAWQLSLIAAGAPAKSGTAPSIDLPFTSAEAKDALQRIAPCQAKG